MFTDWSSVLGITLDSFKMEARSKNLTGLLQLKSTYGTSALTIVDIEKNQYLFVDSDIEKVTGIRKEKYLQKGPRHTLRIASLEHLKGLVTSTLHQRRFFSKLEKAEQDRYVFNREFSYQGTPRRWVLHQVIRHLVNPQGNVFAVAVLQTRIDKLKTDKRFRYYLFDKVKNEVVFPKEHRLPKLSGQITARELQIMRLMAQGKTSLEIAEELDISFHTVRTHRKNIFKKLKCRNVLEMAAKLSEMLPNTD